MTLEKSNLLFLRELCNSLEVDVWCTDHLHPIRATGIPVLVREGRRQFIPGLQRLYAHRQPEGFYALARQRHDCECTIPRSFTSRVSFDKLSILAHKESKHLRQVASLLCVVLVCLNFNFACPLKLQSFH